MQAPLNKNIKMKIYKIIINTIKKMEEGVFIFIKDEIYIEVGRVNNNTENIIW